MMQLAYATGVDISCNLLSPSLAQAMLHIN